MASSFHWLDYLLCSLSLLVSLSVGIFYGVKGSRRTRHKTEEFLLAGRNLNVVAVALSLFVSYMSAITFIGDPVEVYYNGAIYSYIGIGYCLSMIPVAHVFAPVFNQMGITSAYEYLNKRYNHAVQLFVSGVNIIGSCLYLSIAIYAPSVALSQVTGLTNWISILLLGCVGTFYTALGGIRAVVWVDAVQSIIMVIGLMTVLIQGLISIGGFSNMWKIAEKGGRLNFLKSSWSPFTRSTVLSYLVGGFFRTFVPYTSVQAFVQRYSTVSSPRRAKLAVYLNIPIYGFFVIMLTLIGLTMYGYYEDCDPLQQGRIHRPDQLVPLFMLDVLHFLPGLPGIFLASIFAASLSSVSSIMNSLAANILKDFVEPIYLRVKGQTLSDHLMSIIAKATTIFFGILVTTLAFGTLFLKTNVFPITLKVTGVFAGPLAALFLCGICFAFVKTWSIVIAATTSLALCFWLGIGAFFYPPPQQSLPTFSHMCGNSSYVENITDTTQEWSEYINMTSHANNTEAGFMVSDVYHLSPLLYSPLGYTVTLVLTLLCSALQMCCRKVSGRRNKARRHSYISYKSSTENLPLN